MLQKAILGLGSVGTIGGCVYYTKRVRDRREAATEAARRQALFKGSIDDQMSDTLAAGDILIFDRDCSALHIPMALHCMATKQLLSSSFDHVGIIFNDRKTRLPMVLEALPWQGVKTTPFVERLVHDDASQVMLMKLNVPSVNSHKERRSRERIDVFGESTRTSAKVPTSAKDSVGLVLNALLSARILARDPKISNMTPADLPLGRLQLNEGCKLEDPVALRIS